jgi:hypothetical protein
MNKIRKAIWAGALTATALTLATGFWTQAAAGAANGVPAFCRMGEPPPPSPPPTKKIGLWFSFRKMPPDPPDPKPKPKPKRLAPAHFA